MDEKKPNILIVDDDDTFLLSLTDGFLSQDCDFNVFTAGNGKEALTTLESQKIDMVVTDLKMPEMDGFELVAHISQYYKDIPVIIITAFGTPDIEKDLHKLGTFQYLEKPLDLNALEEKISEGLKHKSFGYAKGISLTSFIQVIGLESETCLLKVKSGDKTGFLCFAHGTVIDAGCDNIRGEEAAYEIVTWKKVEIGIETKYREREKTIDMSINQLLIEAHRRIDESKLKIQEELGLPEDLTPGKEDLKQPVNENNENLNIKKENYMNIKKLNEAIIALKEDIGEGLLATDIFTISDGQSIAGYNTQPRACALFSRMTIQVNKALKEAGFPILGQYYMLDLADKKRVIVIPLGDYIWGILVDGQLSPLGLLLNIALPKVIDAFESALTS
jgi:CheY-like chemotaxis protein